MTRNRLTRCVKQVFRHEIEVTQPQLCTMDVMSKESSGKICPLQSSLLSHSDMSLEKKNAFLKYTTFLHLQYISLATIVTFWINLLSL